MSTPDATTQSRTVRAVAALKPGDVDAPSSFADVEVELGPTGEHDLLVEVRAVSVNPVDLKTRVAFDTATAPKILGYDAAGVVVETGSAVTAFAVGDEVYYAGTLARPGTNAERHLVDERIVGHKPSSLSFTEAAAVPLTTITAWETLFDRMQLTSESSGTLLVVGGAGGVGSMVTQLARQLTQVTIIATASRDESREWALAMGAHHVVNHHNLREEVMAVAPAGVDHIFSPFSAGNEQVYADLMPVHGQVVAIDGPKGFDVGPLKAKAQTWHWESMFARPLFDPTSTAQRELLDAAAQMFDAGTLRTTLTRTLHGVTAETLREAHRQLEGSTMVGKLVLEG
ncbi:zinc-binding alcohol dehydrogenase family protein [Tessaracoccus antarcticus]|uniref:Zinc-type alcohol dehydrogenase-like protein n=1 Tax=Tessaracoccus antarcticus TaxID=2479848 RepID=A0A3M0G8M5_9ACTN|nr:zinc-binding alcohol dehydrogenase family protein [Tessaracoccus antarcticus]RMB61380.1 zinc-binding alcohol dehydrogenase family protein [Tessaracoccus antarcticus]